MQLNRDLLLGMLIAFTTGITNLSAQEISQSNEVIVQKWRIALNGGVGYRLASTKDTREILIQQGYSQSQVDKYFKSIKWGPKASGQVHYMLISNYGVGIDYQFHQSSGSITGTIDPGDGLTLYYGTTEDKVFTNYAGLSLYGNQWIIENKLNWVAQTSIGLTLFRQESISFYTPVLITGKALGINFQTGLDYMITKSMALGLYVNYFQSTVSKIEVNDGSSTSTIELEKEMYEGLSRLDAGFGVSFYF